MLRKAMPIRMASPKKSLRSLSTICCLGPINYLKMSTTVLASLGTPGQPWGSEEKDAWSRAQTVQRSFKSLVLERVEALRGRFEVQQYGTLSYSEQYPLLVVKSLVWDDNKPTVLVTGGGAWCIICAVVHYLVHYLHLLLLHGHGYTPLVLNYLAMICLTLCIFYWCL